MEQLKIPKAGEGETIHREPVKSNEFCAADTMLFHAGQLAKTFAAKQLHNRAHSKARALFKNSGVGLKWFDIIDDISQQDDPLEAFDRAMREMFHIANVFIGLPPGTQVDLFAGPASALADMERAETMGHNRGLMGLSPDEQAYPPNTPLGQKHLEGWYAGQAKLKQQFEAHNERERQAEAEKKAKADEAAKRKAEREAKAAEKAGRTVPKTEGGETVN